MTAPSIRPLFVDNRTVAVALLSRHDNGLPTIHYAEVSNGEGMPLTNAEVAYLLRELADALEVRAEQQPDA